MTSSGTTRSGLFGSVTLRPLFKRFTANETFNFIFTNHIPRSLLTRWVGRLSKVEQPLVTKLTLWVWRFFSDLDLSEAKQTEFKSMHECFTRELKAGARPIDRDSRVMVSPCDAIVGACGVVEEGMVLQAKGLPYALFDLLRDPSLAAFDQGGTYVTLRLTSSMYHRFHAPYDGVIERVNYIAGDVFNVNPPTLKRIANLFCKNERAVIRIKLQPTPHIITLVPVAAVLVASIRLHCLNVLLHMAYEGPTCMSCNQAVQKGQELGWFEHGSTIIVFAPRGFALCQHIVSGRQVKMGEPLMLLDQTSTAHAV
jgi:phosphatidylserine decarboxylase